MSKKKRYLQLNEIEHIILKSPMFVGSLPLESSKEFIVQKGKMVKKNIMKSPAIEKLFWEILSNATDNAIKSREAEIDPGEIKVTVSDDKKTITFYNEGRTIPLDDEGEGADMVFSQLRSGENFDVENKRKGAGTYGYGAKLTNIFSKEFIVEIGDGDNGLQYKRKYENSMSIKHDHEIKKYKGQNFVKITYTLDFDIFYKGTDQKRCYTDDMLDLFRMHLYGSSFSVGLVIHYNQEKIDKRDIKDYTSSFFDLKTTKHILLESKNSKALILDTPNKGSSISFVNGTITKEGGKHVEAWYDVVTKYLKDTLNLKKGKVTKREIKQHFSIIVNCQLEDPEFRGQIKDKLLKPSPKTDKDPKTLEKMMKWDGTETLRNMLDFVAKQKDMIQTKKERNVDLVQFMDAPEAGKKESYKCTLLLVEGKSAYAAAVACLSYIPKKDRKYYGILAMQGVVLNAMNADDERFAKNEEILKLYKALGLCDGVDYSNDDNFFKLRYGDVMFMTDADHDGIHIKGLEILLFYHKHPSLIGRKFLRSLVTPLLKVKYRSKTNYFYSKQEHQIWATKNNVQTEPKYIKGLGTLESEDHEFIVDQFLAITYVEDEETKEKLTMAFNKDYSSERKDWLKTYKKDYIPFVPTEEKDEQTISNFIEKELIIFSIRSNQRSIPKLIDGLKPSQRKILFTLLSYPKKKFEKSLKVAQFAPSVSEKTLYEHGEKSLEEAIFKMMQEYPGSNNLPLIKGEGQIGTLLEGGEDHGGSRYVFLNRPKYLEYIFRKEDNLIITHETDDELVVEPKEYFPIIPLVLINGAAGIGTGHSTDIPCYRPGTIITWLKMMIKIRKGEIVDLKALPPLIPWYRNYGGKIYIKKSKIYSEGVIKDKGKELKISVLPINVWVSSYKKILTKMREEKKIKEFDEFHGIKDNNCIIDFRVSGGEATIRNFKLRSTIPMTNFVLFNEDGRLQKFEEAKHILFSFFDIRIKAYKTRKDKYLKVLEEKMITSDLKSKFIQDVANEELIIKKRKDHELEKEMKERGYPLAFLEMPMKSITIDNSIKAQKEAEKAKEDIEECKKSDILDIYLEELEELEKHIKNYL